MKILLTTILAASLVSLSGCAPVNNSTKPEITGSNATAKKATAARAGYNWKWLAGIVAVGLLVNELQDDKNDNTTMGDDTNGF